MTSNLVIKRKISPIQIKRNYLKHRMFFSPVFIEFLKSIWIFENFEKKKKMSVISNIRDSKRRGYLNV